ncbi:uncharacterized protein [Temnothorax nylanderi]|uniref:uncharacterized protein n=1 Tax=Temnothorax nylanderi TaxID=102681 RepID=UPI003A8B2C63
MRESPALAGELSSQTIWGARKHGSRERSVARLARLEGSREDLRRRFERVVGAGLDGDSSGVSGRFSWVEIDTAFQSRVLTGAVTNSTYIEPARFLEDAKGTVLEKVQDNLNRYVCLKVNTIFNGEFVADVKTDVKSIATRNEQLLQGSDLGEWYEKHVRDAILAALDEFQERDSGWALSRILNLTVNVNKCNPMRVGCWMKIPLGIRLKQAVVNVLSENDTCFARAVVAALYPAKHNAERCGSYPDYATVLNLDGIKFPIDLKQIGKFERQNDVSINVFTTREGIEKKNKFGRGADRNAIVPLRLTDDKRDRHVNLLYLRDTLRGVNRGHFDWIKNLSRLVNSQLTAKRCAKHVCDQCLHYFYTREKLAGHSVDCGRMNDCAIVLPNEDDKWLSFDNHYRKERLPSWYSYKFLAASLETLASYLDKDKLRITRSENADLSTEDLDMLTRKGVFPYEYVDSEDKLRETELPPREVFYNSLTDETASESDYEHATRRVMGWIPRIIIHCPGTRGTPWLRYTGVRFELLTDIDMAMFVKRGIRGGLSQCSLRYARAKNRHVPTYDSSSHYVSHVLRREQSVRLGYGRIAAVRDFQWLDDPENFDVTTVPTDSEVGYILEVDLEYPPELHDAHADLPLCPTRDKPPGKRQEKLLATLYDKSRYVTHYRNLQTRASNEFERNMYKLMNNAVFGKTMENVRAHVDVRLVTRWDGKYGAEALIGRPNFHSRSVFSENLVAIELRKLEVKFNKPVYVGMCILEISKTRLYEVHYDYMAPLYRDRCRILYN